MFIGRTDAKAETLILWPPDAKNWLIGKDLVAAKDWRWEEKGTTEDQMVGWHHWLDGHEFEQAPGAGDGQGSLACCSPWGLKVQFSSVTQSCPTLCNPMKHSTPGFPVPHQLLELAQTPVHQVDEAIQPSDPLLSPSPPALNLSQHQGLFQWVKCWHSLKVVLWTCISMKLKW